MGMELALGALVGLAGASMMSKGSSSSSGASYSPVAYASSAPTSPEPIDVSQTESGTTNNPEMEAAAEKEKQAALLRQQRNQSILTSGLGATGLAATQKKELLGG